MSKILDTSHESILAASQCILQGGLVAFPTETVYGLGANGLDPIAVAKIFEAKGRPQDNPLILHISCVEDFQKYAQNIPDFVYKIAKEYSPGPITFVLEKKDLIPTIVTAGLDTVCLRIPNNIIALELIRCAGIPIAGPSANTSGRPSPTTANHVMDDLDGKIDYIIDGGETQIGIESTVIDCTGDSIVILREGVITKSMLESILGIELDQNSGSKKSPGTRYRHYAPNLPIYIFKSNNRNTYIEKIQNNENIGIIYFDTDDRLLQHPNVFAFSDLETYSHRLFAIFRECEANQISALYIEELPEGGISGALMNRISKAASGL